MLIKLREKQGIDLLRVCGGDRVYVRAVGIGAAMQRPDSSGYMAHIRYSPTYAGANLPAKREPYLRGTEVAADVPYDIDFGYFFAPIPGQIKVVGGIDAEIDVFYTVTSAIPRGLSHDDLVHTLSIVVSRTMGPIIVPRPRGATHISATFPSFVNFIMAGNSQTVALLLGIATPLGPADQIELSIPGLYFFRIVL
jgi:hypothetical protein